ncbi:MAG: nuclear transport factor 2 family protein [Caulobacteraceae bacterium]
MGVRAIRGGVLALAAVAIVAGFSVQGGAASAAQAKAAPSMETRIRAIEDRLALQELLGQYDKALDARDWAAYAACFTEDGEMGSRTSTTKGRTKIRDSLTTTMTRVFSQPGAPAFLQHNVDTLLFSIDGDNATGTSHWSVIGVTDDKKPIVTEAGHYEDVYRRVDGRWQFARRLIIADFPRAPAAAPAAATSGARAQ